MTKSVQIHLNTSAPWYWRKSLNNLPNKSLISSVIFLPRVAKVVLLKYMLAITMIS